jgi:two-component sensor histidine kinase
MKLFLESIEFLSKSEQLRKGNIRAFTELVLKTSARTLKCGRANAWLLNKKNTELNCFLSYSLVDDSFSSEGILNAEDLPNYFSFLTKNEIIVSDDAENYEMNKELTEGYLKVHKIKSMIDVPIRSEGKMIGVVCVEHTNDYHSWSDEEIVFVQSITQLISLSLETDKKNKHQRKQAELIQQKETLLYEINHRVKNNLAVIISLINLQNRRVKDDYHSSILTELANKVNSISTMQTQLHNSRSHEEIELRSYMKSLAENIHSCYALGKNIKLNLDLDKSKINAEKAITLGLIANEILTNSYKYAFTDINTDYELKTSIKIDNDIVTILFKDNGPGYSEEDILNGGMGLTLVKGLVRQIDGNYDISSHDGVEIKISCPI